VKFSRSIWLAPIFLFSQALAQSPEAPTLIDQFKKDLLTLVSEKTPQSSADQRKAFAEAAFAEVNREFPATTSATPAQLETLRGGQCPFTDDQIRQAYTDLKTLAAGKPMPDIVEFYKQKFDGGQLNAAQKTIFCDLSSAIRDRIRSNR
jgi:hypothetical protein